MANPTRPVPPDQLLDIPALAQQLNTSVRHIRRLIAEHRVPVIRVGRLIRFDPTDIAQWLDENRQVPHGGPAA